MATVDFVWTYQRFYQRLFDVWWLVQLMASKIVKKSFVVFKFLILYYYKVENQQYNQLFNSYTEKIQEKYFSPFKIFHNHGHFL